MAGLPRRKRRGRQKRGWQRGTSCQWGIWLGTRVQTRKGWGELVVATTVNICKGMANIICSRRRKPRSWSGRGRRLRSVRGVVTHLILSPEIVALVRAQRESAGLCTVMAGVGGIEKV